ncbi:MAG TPA: hypothetical protein VHR88_07245 [Solirubrobacteraceae bacterium]|jgi:hypothetical protein|nr:hypothetical protein [Solirubrobacteraceae bacterium]
MRRFTLMLVALCAAALTIASTASAAGPTASAAAYHFSGKTSQNEGFEMRLASSFRTTTLHFQYEVQCASGLQFPDERIGTVRNTLVYKTGHHVSRVKFDASGPFQVNVTAPNGQSVTGTSNIHVAGKIRLDTGNANGRIEADVALSNGDHCTTGNSPVTWTAHVG